MMCAPSYLPRPGAGSRLPNPAAGLAYGWASQEFPWPVSHRHPRPVAATVQVVPAAGGAGPAWDVLTGAGFQSSCAWFESLVEAALPAGARPEFWIVAGGGRLLLLLPMLAGPGRRLGSLTTAYTTLFQPLAAPGITQAELRAAGTAVGRLCRGTSRDDAGRAGRGLERAAAVPRRLAGRRAGRAPVRPLRQLAPAGDDLGRLPWRPGLARCGRRSAASPAPRPGCRMSTSRPCEAATRSARRWPPTSPSMPEAGSSRSRLRACPPPCSRGRLRRACCVWV